MTVGDRIRVHAGTIRNPLLLQQLVNEASRLVIGELPEEVLIPLASEETDSGSGVDVANKRIISAHKAGYEARHLDADIRARIAEEDNTYEAVQYSPAYYVLGTTAYVKPDGGTIVTISAPSVGVEDITVSGVPSMILDLIVLRASELALDYLLVTTQDDHSTAITLPTAPTAPSAPSISYSDASAVAPSAVTIASLPTAPTYSAPTLASKPSVPTVGTLDLTLKVDGATALTAPTAPSAPSIAYSDATAATISATSISALPTIPSYSAASFGGSLSLPTLPSDLDLSDELDATTALDPPTAPSAPAITYSNASAATAAATTVAALGTAPAYTKPTFAGNIASITSAIPSAIDLTTELDNATALTVPSPPAAPTLSSAGLSATTVATPGTPPTYTKDGSTLSFTDWDTYKTAEDPEMMGQILSKIGVELQEIQTEIQDEKNEFEEELAVYRGDLERLIAQAQVTLQEQVATLNQADQMALQDYVQGLAQYDRALGEYQANVSVQLQKFETDVKRATVGLAEAQRLYVQTYKLDIDNEMAEFQKELVAYQQDATHKIEQARVTLQEAIADARASTDIAAQNAAKALESLAADYDRELARFQAQLQTYGAEVDRQVQQFNANYQKAFEPWREQQSLYLQEYGQDIAAERDRYQGQMQDHMREVDRLIQQAQITAQEAVTQAQLTTDVAVQNELQTLAAAVKDYENELVLYRAKAELYGLEVNAVIQQFVEGLDRSIQVFSVEGQLDTARYQAEVQDALNAFQQSLSVYQATLERNNLQAQIARQEAQQTAQNSTEIAVQNEARTLEAAIADYQANLGLFQEQLRLYAQQAEVAITESRTKSQTVTEKLRMMHFDKERVSQQYQRMRMAVMRYMWPSRSYTIQMPVI